MNNRFRVNLIFIGILIFFQVNGNHQNKFEPAKESELREGECGKAVLADMMFQDHIKKPAIPFLTRNSTVKWHGDAKIYCVIVEPQKDQSPGSSITVREGGVNHTFIHLEIQSKKSEGLDYAVQVFGKKI